jgi:iron-sulfur cluster assembly protein
MNEIIVTEAAAGRIQQQLEKRGHGIGLRLGVKVSGCSGYAYVMDYAEDRKPDDQVINAHGVQVFVDPVSLPILSGMQLDFRREGLNELFKFDNPNAGDHCGCGESFTVAAPKDTNAS